MGGRRLTELLEHLVALIKDEMFDVLRIENLVASEGVEATWSCDDNVRALGLVPQGLGIFGDGHASVECRDADIGHVLGEATVLVFDLEGKFARVTENDDGHFPIHGLELLQRRKHENSRLSVTRLCLAQDIHSQDCLRNTLLLNYERWFLV